MNDLNFELQGFSLKFKSPQQQDAMLIAHKVLQHDRILSKRRIYPIHEAWCTALADGVSQSPQAQLASKKILQLVDQNQSMQVPFNFALLQQQFCQYFSQLPEHHGTSTTLITLTHSQSQFIEIQHLGNSRAYLYSLAQATPQWRQLTRDHSFIEELLAPTDMQNRKSYASCYDMLTQYFCADDSHEVCLSPIQEQFLTENEALVICTDGIYQSLACSHWPLLQPNLSLANWLLQLKEKLEQHKPYDNASIVIVRLTSSKVHPQ